MGPLISLFLTSSDVSSGFQSQSGQPYSRLAEAYVLHVTSDEFYEFFNCNFITNCTHVNEINQFIHHTGQLRLI